MDNCLTSKKEHIKTDIDSIMAFKENIKFTMNYQCIGRLKIIRDNIDVFNIPETIINKLNEALQKIIDVLEAYEKLKQYQKRCNLGVSSKKDKKALETLEECINIFEDYILDLEFPELTYQNDFDKAVKSLEEFLNEKKD